MLKKLLAKLMGSQEKKKPRKKTPGRAKKTTLKKKKPSKKKTAASPAEKEIGRVVAFFRIPVVAVIRVTQGTLKLGDQVWIRGHTTKLKQTLTSMQINHQPISKARKGDEFGVKVSSRARIGDRVYRVSA